MRWWRLYLALAVPLVLAADVQPNHATREVGPQYVIYAYTDIPDGACGVPAAVAFSEPQDAYLQRNRVASQAFGGRPSLATQEAIRHYSCVRAVTVQLDLYRQMGAASVEQVRVMLDWLGLRRVQVVAAPDGIRFGGSTGDVCVAGIYMPKQTVVAAIAPLPDTDRCLT